MKWFVAVAFTLIAQLSISADELPPGYLITERETELVYSLQRAGYPVTEIREEIELDVWEATPLPGDRSARTLKKATIAAKPGMYLVRTEREIGPFAGQSISSLRWSSAFRRSSFESDNPRPPEGGTPTKPHPVRLLLPNQPVFAGTPRPLPEHRLTNQPFTAEQLKLGRTGLAGEPMGDTTWLPDGEHWLQAKEGKLWKIVARTGRAVELFVNPRNLLLSLANLPGIDYKTLPKELAMPKYKFDPTFKAILLKHNKSNYIAFRDGNNGFELGEFEVPAFSPDGKLLAFVRKGNLHVGDLKTGKVNQLTTDGGKNDILNGRADWIYEEEIFHRRGQAYWWSPDSKQIAFLRFDDSQVPKFALTHNDQRLGTVETINYPKPGDKNPIVRVGVINLSDPTIETRFLQLDEFKLEDTVVSRLGWASGDSSVPFAYVQNRTQTRLNMIKWTDDFERERLPIFTLHAESGPWQEDLGEPRWLSDGSFLILGDYQGHIQLYHLGNADRTKNRLIIEGAFEVKSILQVDEKAGVVKYLRSNDRGTGTTMGIAYLDQKKVVKSPASPTGDFTARYSMAPKGEMYVAHTTKDDLPTFTRLFTYSKPNSRTLDSNPCHEREKFRFGKYERTKIKTRTGFEMEAAITYPPDFHELNKYPIWMLTYGGPNAPTIKDGWAGGRVFEQILAAQGIVVVRVDPQSASGKGMVNAKVCYKQLGVKELQDLEDAVDWLAKKPWADTKRVGLSGHSYGGFLTAFALTHSKKFSTGIAGAPVTDWRLYDSIYTERYMGLPSENKEGYDKTSVIKAAKDLHGELLIVHGLIDDNVHAQNSLQLISALQKAGKDFEVMVYPDDRHGITGTHYPQTMLKFIQRTMGVKK